MRQLILLNENDLRRLSEGKEVIIYPKRPGDVEIVVKKEVTYK